MLLRCLMDHQVSQNESMHFEPGKVYRFDGPFEELGRRLLQDFGKNSRHQARYSEVKFERVAVEGDSVQVVEDGAPVAHTVTADEAYSGEIIDVTPQGPVMAGESGTVDHTHLSQSEPQTQPPYAPEGEGLDPVEGEEHDHTTATEGGSGNGAPLGQVGTGEAGDTLSTDVGAKAPSPPEYTSESNVGAPPPPTND